MVLFKILDESLAITSSDGLDDHEVGIFDSGVRLVTEKHSEVWTLYFFPRKLPWTNFWRISQSPSLDKTQYCSLALCFDLSFFR